MTDDELFIRNCRFAFKCNKTWESLENTKSLKIRYCDSCDRGVHYCSTDQELVAAIEDNRCIAINKIRKQTGVEWNDNFVGRIESPEYKIK